MPTTRKRSDFINFILDAEKNQKLIDEFLKITKAIDLDKFFKRHKYFDIPFNDCQEILNARKTWVPTAKGKTPKCPPGAKVY